MTKRQTRAFFLGSTGVFTLIFIVLTIDGHRQFPRLTHARPDHAGSHRREARVAPEELHQLPHAPR